MTAPTLHFAVYGDPATGRVATAPFAGSVEVVPVFGDGAPAVWRWSRPRIDERPDDLVCRTVSGRLGERVDVFQKDWLHRDASGSRRKKLRTIWLAAEVGSTDTAVAELKADRRARLRVAEADRAGAPDPRRRCRRRAVLDFFAGSGTTGHAVALANAADGGRRTCLSVNSAEPTRAGLERRTGRAADRRRHHPRPAAGRRRDGRRRLQVGRARERSERRHEQREVERG